MQRLNYSRSATSVTSKAKLSNMSAKLVQITNKSPAHFRNLEVSEVMEGIIREISFEICHLNLKYFLNRFKNLDFEHVDELQQSFHPVGIRDPV